MLEIEETEYVDLDGVTKKHRIVRGISYIRVTHTNGTVEEMSGLPPGFIAEQFEDDFLRDESDSRKLWRIPNYLFERLRQSVESGIANELFPRSIALMNEHGETFVELMDILAYSMRSMSGGDIVLGHEVDLADPDPIGT